MTGRAMGRKEVSRRSKAEGQEMTPVPDTLTAAEDTRPLGTDPDA